jgi:hypothetical protein
MRGETSNMIIRARGAVDTSSFSGAQIGQYARALSSCSLVGFSAVSRLPMRGQSSNTITGAQGAVGTSCVSGFQIGQ